MPTSRLLHEAIKGLKCEKDITLAALYREPLIKFRTPVEKLLTWAEKTHAAGPQKPVIVSFIYAERTRTMANHPGEAPVPLQVLRVGDLCIGTMPCEVFCEIGLECKKRSPSPDAFLMSISHGDLGYLTSPRQHEPKGYETWIRPNRLMRNAPDDMLADLPEMAQELFPAKGK